MRKKVLLASAILVVAISASAMMAGIQWAKVQDTCGKCVINTYDRKCGKCGGYMNSGADEYIGNGWTKCTYTCKKCSHSATYKSK